MFCYQQITNPYPYTTALTTGQTLTLAGARQFGGGVESGSMYRVGENNQPEFLQTSSGLMMIPGDRGNVIPANATGSSGGNITVHNYGSSKVSTSRDSAGNTTITLQDVENHLAQQMRNNTGTFMRGLKTNTNTRHKAR